jgi:hypothetical protein
LKLLLIIIFDLSTPSFTFRNIRLVELREGNDSWARTGQELLNNDVGIRKPFQLNIQLLENLPRLNLPVACVEAQMKWVKGSESKDQSTVLPVHAQREHVSIYKETRMIFPFV